MHIFIEGLQGMGKTTLLEKLAQKYPEYHAYREGDYCPIELAWCSYLTKEEYEETIRKYPSLQPEIERWTTREKERYIVAYTRIITDIPGFHKYMEQFEIYNGRRSKKDFEAIILNRCQNLLTIQNSIFECAFFQNIIEELILFQEQTDEEICSFYRELFSIVNKTDFVMYYLNGQNIENRILQISKERSDEKGNQIWYPLMLEYLKQSPYGQKHHLGSFEDMLAHFRHRQQLERRIIQDILGSSVQLLPACPELENLN